MADIQRFADFTLEQRTFYERVLLERAKPNLIHAWLGQKGRSINIPSKNGDTVDFRAFTSLAAATTPITEGVTPSATDVAMTHVQSTVKQYGTYIQYSDLIDTMAIDSVMTEFSLLLGEQAGLTVDTLVRDVVAATTNIVYANGTGISDIGSTHKISASLILKAKRTLDNANAQPMDNGNYIMIVSPYTVYDLMQDSTIQNVMQNVYERGDDNPMMQGYIGTVFGIDIYQSSQAKVYEDSGSGSIDVHASLVFGRNAFGVGGLAGMMFGSVSASQYGNDTGKRVRPVELLTTSPGDVSKEDPLGQRGTVAWKTTHTAVILNNSFMVKILHAVSS